MAELSNNKIRVLYVVENRSFGGGERGFGQLSTNINRDRFQPFVAAHSGGQLEVIVRQNGVPFCPLDMSRRVNLGTIGHLSTLISENDIDIVHSMGARADFFARMACRNKPSTAVVCTLAMLVESFDVGFLRKFFYKLADRYSARYVTQYIAVSRALKERLIRERKISADKISIIYNGVELDQYNPELYSPSEGRLSLGIKDDYPIVGTIGRLVYQKGLPYFLEAAARVYFHNKEVRFVIIGHGSEEASLKNLADSLGITHACTFAGQRFDIDRLLSAFDIFVLPSLLEGLPRVVIEAMAMARPIIATDIDGVREQITNNQTGLLVKPADSKLLAKAIMEILDDEQKANSLARKARKQAEQKFDLKLTINKVENLYQELFDSLPTK
jgi:glycosyltransferase involved in cell wall biosynthesis